MTANGIASGLYHNVIKSTGNSAIYKPSSSILTNPLTDKYTIGENIGRGKFAVVKKCISIETGEEVAAKFIKKRRRGKSCREEILREVVMLEMALEHPRLVNLKEVYETSTELILITEYCAGGELFTECILEEKFNEADVRLLMSQILEGLVYLHDKNIVHLDLKPQNILLTHEFPEGSIKICDLGFACLVNTGEDIRDIIGTPDYVAPEVLNYDPLGLYTDMWSLGVLTYVMLTTCSPFAGDDKQQTFCNITTVNLDFPQDLFEEISDAAQDFIRKLLIAEPSERMTAAECMQHDWITGGQSLARPISAVEERENASLPDITVTNEEASSAVSHNDADINKPELHEKVRDETSEMSVTEDIEDSCPTIGSESDMKAVEQTESNMKVDTSVSNSEILSGIETESNKSTNVISDNSKSTDEIKNAKIVPTLITDDIQTPDSESSMCISDSKLDDDDSGVGTGTETRAESETRNISGRSSTDYITDKDYDTDVIEELNTDQEHVEESTVDQDMPNNKCLLENNLDGTPDGNETVQELNETRNINNLSVESDINTINSHVTVVVEGQAEMEHSDLINITQTSDLTDIHSSSISEKEDKSDPILGSPTVDSSETRIPDFQPMDQTSPSSIHKLHISFRDVHTSSNLINLPNNSVEKIGTGLDETVQAVPSSGEKLKRVMCNPNTTQGADNSENVDQEEYEFVSVSKRVKSYEESLTVTRNQQISPKIQRSPRTGRHLKSHHQHH